MAEFDSTHSNLEPFTEEFSRSMTLGERCDKAEDAFKSAFVGAAPALLSAARLAEKAAEFLRVHGDITGIALAAAEQAEHIKVDRAALRALGALRKEFGFK